MSVAKTKNQRLQKFNSIEDMQSFYAELKNVQGDGGDIGLDFNIDYYSDDVCGQIVEIAAKVSEVGFKPHVRVCGRNLEFTKAEIENFETCEDELNGSGVEFYISDELNLYSLDETMVAYARLRAIADEIKSHKGSPFEKFLEIYGYVTSYIYKNNEEDLGSSRDIISIMNGDDIVCVGYAKLMEYLCKEVGIDCRCARCDLFTNEGQYYNSHQCNLVYLKDEKYGIDGWYHVDACWDSVKNGGKPYLNYNYCLIPVEDIQFSNNKRFDFYKEAEAVYGDINELFIDYFNNPPKLKKCMDFLDLEINTKIPAVNKNEYNLKTRNAIGMLIDALERNKIPSDIYQGLINASGIFEIESLIALCMVYQNNEVIIDYILRELKKRYNDSVKTSGTSLENDIYNVYEYLTELKEKNPTVEERKKLRFAEVVINNEKELFDKVLDIRESGKSISLKKFAVALKNNAMRQGQTKEQAEVFALRAIKHTTKRSKNKFDETARNAFSQKALKLAAIKGDN